MPRVFECPDGQSIDDRFIDFGYLRCGANNQFIEVTNQYDIFSLLFAITDFSPTQVVMYTSAYLAFFITGVGAGLITRQFKKT